MLCCNMCRGREGGRASYYFRHPSHITLFNNDIIEKYEASAYSKRLPPRRSQALACSSDEKCFFVGLYIHVVLSWLTIASSSGSVNSRRKP